jgi:hypothetical protein
MGSVLTWRFAGILAGPYYGAMLHTVFVGLVFAMIFAHAPIILPAMLGRTTSRITQPCTCRCCSCMPRSCCVWLEISRDGGHVASGVAC